jgi:hypothetical protein
MNTPNVTSESEMESIIKKHIQAALEKAFEEIVSIVGSDNEAWLEDNFGDMTLNTLADCMHEVEV